MSHRSFVVAALLAIACASSASADVVISSNATQNMSCTAGVCAPTATNAVLNVGDLENLLAAGNVSVVTTNGSVQANNIDIAAAFSWSVANSLALDAYQSITFSAVVQNLSTGNVSLVTNDGGTGGALTFSIGSGRLDANAVSINGKVYTTAKSIKQLAVEVVAHPKGRFALSKDVNAGKDGLYYNPPIPIPFLGTLNGLGHTIADLEIADSADNQVGLFAWVKPGGSIASIVLDSAVVDAASGGAGALAGLNEGAIRNSSVSGTIRGNTAGGLVGDNEGTVTASQSAAIVHGGGAGGLVGVNGGTISVSFATGRVSGREIGGLSSANGTNGSIENSYASGNLLGGRNRDEVGGLVGYNYEGSISASYAIGEVSANNKHANIGGFDGGDQGTIATSYWDTETSGTDQGSGDGNETGLTGLTTQQFQSGLPAGFDPAIWAEDSNINNGFPYLIANPPPPK